MTLTHATPGGTTSSRGRTPRLSPRRSRGIAAPTLLAVSVVAVWWLASTLADSTVFPTPGQSVVTLGHDLGSGRYQNSILTTLRVLALAYTAAALVGGLLGMVLGLSGFWSRVLLPVIYATNSIPKITLYPIFLLFLGISDLSRGAFAFVSGVLPMLLIACEATASVNRLHLKLAASLGLGWTALLTRIIVPSVIPSLASGLRLTFGLTFLGLLLAEMFSGSSGLGFELLRNVSLVRMENITGEVVLIGLLALIPTLLLQSLEHRARRRFEGVR